MQYLEVNNERYITFWNQQGKDVYLHIYGSYLNHLRVAMEFKGNQWQPCFT